ncbi:hypothetical protein [Actinomadura sp. 3N508]|uniref:hypothetical protein n=1 Tax=Actinomadura sp. 3N508 TaxID=3375153 RepID=UPI0037A08200
MDEAVALLLIRSLFAGWTIVRDECGDWRATCCVVVSSGDIGGLLEALAAVDPDAARRAVSLLREC